MSIATRIKRPTTATPRGVPFGRYLWVSTPYGHAPRHLRRRRIGIPATGLTYRPHRFTPR